MAAKKKTPDDVLTAPELDNPPSSEGQTFALEDDDRISTLPPPPPEAAPGAPQSAPEPITQEYPPKAAEPVLADPEPAAAPIPTRSQKKAAAGGFRVWAHGGLQYNGTFYPPGAPIRVSEAVAAKIGEAVERVPEE